MIDKAGPKPNSRTIGETITQPLKQRNPIEKTKKKWIDDFSVMGCLDLKAKLKTDPAPNRPVSYHGRMQTVYLRG